MVKLLAYTIMSLWYPSCKIKATYKATNYDKIINQVYYIII